MRYLFIFLISTFLPSALFAQFTGPLESRFQSINQNAVSVMEAFGDSLWIGPRLNYRLGHNPDWLLPSEADSVLQGRGRVFSLALARDTVVAGLGFNDTSQLDNPQTQMGIYISTDGGQTFTLSGTDKTLDTLTDDNTVIFTDDNGQERTMMRMTYGGREILASPITVPQQSPPFETDFNGDVMFFAAWASGIRRSTDFGESWERLLLPPFELDELNPEETYDFIFDPVTPREGSRNRQNYPMGWTNFLGFSVHIDRHQPNQVWAGTAGGVNISDNALTAPADSIRWRRVGASGQSNGMLGNWVITIRQNPYNGEVWLTNRISTGQGEQNGLVSTDDNGHSFRHHLIGEIINDVHFDGQHIYAAGDNGLFISQDNGNSWRQIRQLQSANTFIKAGTRYFSLAKTSDAVWVGTADGLAFSKNQGHKWSIIRTNVPLRGGNQFQPDAPDVSTYAYPNPFSPRVHNSVRIVFEVEQPQNVTVQIFDFGMNLIRTFDSAEQKQPGVYEVVWNGQDMYGRQAANGPTFYRVSTGNKTADGKILILE